MNAKILRVMVTVFAAGALIWPMLAQSYELPYLFSDPLRTMPDMLEKGVILPGDNAPIPRTVQKDFSQPLTLAEAVDLALSNNQKVKGAWADIKVQAGTLGQVYATYLPTINGSTNWTNDNLHYSDQRYKSTDTNRYTAQASATWRIFDFGGRSANRDAAENVLAAALATYDATLQEALAEVIQAYFDAMTADASLKAKIKDEEVAQSTLHSAIEREAKGVISQSDTLRATTALAKASLDKNRAIGNFQKTLAVLSHYLGVPVNTELLLPSDFNELQSAVIESKEISLWLEEAQKSHPSIVAARKQLEAAKKGVIVTKSTGLPTVNLSGNYYQNTRPGEAVTPSGSRETTLIVALTIPLFDGFASTYKLRAAQADVEKEAATLADMEQQIALGIIKAHADTTSALQNLEASALLLESAQSALAVSQRRYNKGAADIIEVLSTQTALADALNERVRCLAEWHSARLQLLAKAGKMGRFAVTDSPAN
jgi:outer membrane protein